MDKSKTYLVNHSRKGTFTMRVDSVDETWVAGEVVEGHTIAISQSNNGWFAGDRITVRRTFCTFTEQPNDQ